MSRIRWDGNDQRLFKAGVDRGVLYPAIGPGLAWNGLISVVEDGDKSEVQKIYVDGQVVQTRLVGEAYSGAVTAFTYPDALDKSFRRTFGLSYRVSTDSGYEIHVLYGVLFTPDPRSYATTGSEISPVGISWKTIAKKHVVITSDAASIDLLEDTLYGSDVADAVLPSYEELSEIASTGAVLRITDNGDGTWTAEGPDDVVVDNGDGSFTINSPTAIYLDDVTYRISSY